MRPLLTILMTVTVAASPALIVPGRAIGPARLGATPQELATFQKDTTCPIRALFHEGRAIQLYTNCGGPWATPGGTQVGLPLLWVTREFGQPATIAQGATYSWPGGHTAKAIWYVYRGIAFRAVVPDGEPEEAGVVTCISVFDSQPLALPDGCSPGQHSPWGQSGRRSP